MFNRKINLKSKQAKPREIINYTEYETMDGLYSFVAQSEYESKQSVYKKLKSAAADHSLKATQLGKRLHKQLR